VPNDAVDMDSWASSACYPRRTFYPLSDGPFHAGPPDHYGRLSSLLELSLSQSGGLVPLHFARRGSLRLRLITFFGTPFELALKCADGLPKIGGSVSERRHSVSPSLFVVARRRGAQIVLLLTIPSRASRDQKNSAGPS